MNVTTAMIGVMAVTLGITLVGFLALKQEEPLTDLELPAEAGEPDPAQTNSHWWAPQTFWELVVMGGTGAVLLGLILPRL